MLVALYSSAALDRVGPAEDRFYSSFGVRRKASTPAQYFEIETRRSSKVWMMRWNQLGTSWRNLTSRIV